MRVACCRELDFNLFTGTIPTECGTTTSLTDLCVQCCSPACLRGSMGHATHPTAALHAHCLSEAEHAHMVLADSVAAPGCHWQAGVSIGQFSVGVLHWSLHTRHACGEEAGSGSSARAWPSDRFSGCICCWQCVCVAFYRSLTDLLLITGTIPTEVGTMSTLQLLCVQCCGPAWLPSLIGHGTRPTAVLRVYCLSWAAHVHVVLAGRVVAQGQWWALAGSCQH